MFVSEKAFVTAFNSHLKKLGYMFSRIESHGTESGIPDEFVAGNGKDWWIEFKNEPAQSINAKQWKIHWRPGQQRWYMDYLRAHSQVISPVQRYVKYAITAVALKDGMMFIKNVRMFDDNIVTNDKKYVLRFDWTDLSAALDRLSFEVQVKD